MIWETVPGHFPLRALHDAMSTLGRILSGMAHAGGVQDLSPIAIVQGEIDATRESGLLGFAAFVIAVNLGVGMFNLLPFPLFDGATVATSVYEGVRSLISRREHRVSPGVLAAVTALTVGVFLIWTVVSLVGAIRG